MMTASPVEHRRYTRSEWTVSGDLAVTFYENGDPIWSERYDDTDDAAEEIECWTHPAEQTR